MEGQQCDCFSSSWKKSSLSLRAHGPNYYPRHVCAVRKGPSPRIRSGGLSIGNISHGWHNCRDLKRNHSLHTENLIERSTEYHWVPWFVSVKHVSLWRCIWQTRIKKVYGGPARVDLPEYEIILKQEEGLDPGWDSKTNHLSEERTKRLEAVWYSALKQGVNYSTRSIQKLQQKRTRNGLFIESICTIALSLLPNFSSDKSCATSRRTSDSSNDGANIGN